MPLCINMNSTMHSGLREKERERGRESVWGREGKREREITFK